MTLTSTTNRAQYLGDGTTIAFPVTFVFWQADDLEVVLTDAAGAETVWVRGTHYVVTGGDGLSGLVTVIIVPTNYTPLTGQKITIRSALDEVQATSLPLGGPLPSAAIEQQLDKIVRMNQQRGGELDRALKVPLSEASIASLPALSVRASMLLAFDAGGAPVALSPAAVKGTGTIVSPYMAATVLPAIDPAAARTALGITGGVTDGTVTLPKLADGTAGNLISYDAAGHPVAVATGSVGQILTSNGAGLPPSMQAAPASAVPTGSGMVFFGETAPAGYLLGGIAPQLRATFPALFAVFVKDIGTATFDNTTDVVSLTAHGRKINQCISFKNSGGAVPTGLPALTNLFIIATGFTANAFKVSTSVGGAAINFTTNGTGTTTLVFNPYGIGDGTTTFGIPDSLGRVFMGAGDGDAADHTAHVLGQKEGTETHVLTTAQMPAHTHTFNALTAASGSGFGTDPSAGQNTSPSTGATGGDGAHPNIQPSLGVNWIIKT